MAAQKSVKRKRAKKKMLANRGNEGPPTRAQKRSVKLSLGAIKNVAKDIELRIEQVVGALNDMDWEDD